MFFLYQFYFDIYNRLFKKYSTNMLIYYITMQIYLDESKFKMFHYYIITLYIIILIIII